MKQTNKTPNKTERFNLICILLICGLAVISCTSNQRAKKYGGTTTVELPAKTKLVNVTWKDQSLWYLTRPAREGEKPETLTFQEQSSLGIVQGKVVFKEQ